MLVYVLMDVQTNGEIFPHLLFTFSYKSYSILTEEEREFITNFRKELPCGT